MSILGFTGAVAADGTDNAAVEVEAVAKKNKVKKTLTYHCHCSLPVVSS